VTSTIIESAIRNKALHLELNYCEPELADENRPWIEGLGGDGFCDQTTPELSAEFACLLSVL